MYAVSFMPTASGDCQSLRDLSIFFFFFIIDFNWEGATMPNFVYLNVKCAQDVNMEIFKEQVLSFLPPLNRCMLIMSRCQYPLSEEEKEEKIC